jgi:hypothetical protein
MMLWNFEQQTIVLPTHLICDRSNGGQFHRKRPRLNCGETELIDSLSRTAMPCGHQLALDVLVSPLAIPGLVSVLQNRSLQLHI